MVMLIGLFQAVRPLVGSLRGGKEIERTRGISVA